MNRADVVYDETRISLETIVDEVEDIGFEAEQLDFQTQTELHFQLFCHSDVDKIIAELEKSTSVLDVKKGKQIGRITVTYAASRDNPFGPRSALEILDKNELLADVLREGSDLTERRLRLETIQLEQVRSFRNNAMIAGIGAVPLAVMMVCLMLGIEKLKQELEPGIRLFDVPAVILSTIVQIICGKLFYVSAYHSLLAGGANMDVLVAVGTTTAYLYSWLALTLNIIHEKEVYRPAFETSAILLFVISLGKWLQCASKARTSDSLTSLLELQPPTAMRFVNPEKCVQTDFHLLQIGDLLRVQRGETIPTDGVVYSGKSAINESLLTGESLPVSKAEGANVTGGTININNCITLQVTQVGSHTVLAKIVHMVEKAQASSAPIQEVADEIARYFVPVILGLAISVFAVWIVIAGLDEAFIFSIGVVIVSCPCALGLATPTAIMVATGRAAHLNIFFRGGEILEGSGRVNCVAFDKTGTLTAGKPCVKCIERPKSSSISDNKLFSLISAAEQESEHILAGAIIEFCKKRGDSEIVHPEVHAETGFGLRATIDNADTLLIGSEKWMKQNNIYKLSEFMEFANKAQNSGNTVVWVALNMKIECVFSIGDPIKPNASEVVRYLQRKKFRVVMVTGDSIKTAEAVASNLGIEARDVFAEVDPAGKASVIQRIQQKGSTVAFVGDGINDSVVLAASDVGIAIGSGTDIAVETAGVVLMNSRLEDVVSALDLARVTLRRIYLNYCWAFGYNLLMIPVAAGAFSPWGVLLPHWVEATAMALSSISVVTSSLFLKWYMPPSFSKHPTFPSLETSV